jgi:hypothetical protein
MEGYSELFDKVRKEYKERETYMLEYTKNVKINSIGNFFEYYYTNVKGVTRYYRLDHALVRGFKRAVDRKEIDEYLQNWDDRVAMRKALEKQNIQYTGPIEYIGYKLLSTGVAFKQEGPLIFIEEYPQLVMSEEMYRRYLYHGVQNNKSMSHQEIYALMQRDTVYDIEIYPARESADDGQLKIAVDMILAVEEALNSPQEEIRILALGTAAPMGHKGGTAYDLIPIMARDIKKKIVLDMYDPNEIETYYEDENVKVSKFQEKYQISRKDLALYDLLLDDVYTGNENEALFYEREWDPQALYQRFKYYSIKGFDDKEVPRYKYRQVAKTNSREFRNCSRRTKIHYSGNHRRLGTCPFCRELKYTLSHTYSREFYRKFISMHKSPCMHVEVPKKIVEVFDKYEVIIRENFVKYHVIGDIYDDPRYLTEMTRKVIVELSSWDKYTYDLHRSNAMCLVMKEGYYESTHPRDDLIRMQLRAENYEHSELLEERDEKLIQSTVKIKKIKKIDGQTFFNSTKGRNKGKNWIEKKEKK